MHEVAAYQKMADPMLAAERLGGWLAKSGMFGIKNVEQGQVMALSCIIEQKNPLEIARTYHIIEGKLSMRADAMLAEFRKAGGRVKWLRSDGAACEAVFAHEGQELTRKVTIEEAQRAGWIRSGSAWERTPDAMLRARLASSTIRMMAPEIVAGYYTPEEHQDAVEPREVAATVAPDDLLSDEQREASIAQADQERLDAIAYIEGKKISAELLTRYIRAKQNITDNQDWTQAPLGLLRKFATDFDKCWATVQKWEAKNAAPSDATA